MAPRDGSVLPDFVMAPAHERSRIGDRAVKTAQDFAPAGESIRHGITSIF